jgi:hypothetical protein
LDKGPDQPEVLVSCSTDGDIVQWTTSKGLEHTRLMRLKRLSRQTPVAAVAPAAGSGVAAVQAAAAAKAGEWGVLVGEEVGGGVCLRGWGVQGDVRGGGVRM